MQWTSYNNYNLNIVSKNYTTPTALTDVCDTSDAKLVAPQAGVEW